MSYRKCQEAFRALSSEIESYKRTSGEEMKKNEQLSIIFGRAQTELESNKHTLEVLMEKQAVLEQKITVTAAMTEQTEKDLNIALVVCVTFAIV